MKSGGGKTKGRGRPRKTLRETVNEFDDEYVPYLVKTTERKRGRPRKTPVKMVNEFDDDYNSSFPKTTGRKRGRPRKTTPQMVNESDDDFTPSPHKELSTDGPSLPVQDSGVPFKDPLDTDLVKYVRDKNGSFSHLATTPIDERMNLPETEDDLSCPTKGETVAEEPASEPILQENNASGLLDENIAKDSVSPNSSECGSSIIRSKRYEDLHHSIIPMDLGEDDDHLPQTQQVNVVVAANNAKKTPCQSFNLTEAANKIRNTLHDDDDDDDDEDEIESSIDPALVDVKGYCVRPEISTTLHQILEQHGDIAKDCKVKALRGCFLEKVCSFYEKLQRSSIEDIKRRELKEMRATLNELEHIGGLNVQWLSKKLDDILEVKVFLEGYSKKNKEFRKMKAHLVALEKTTASIRQRVFSLEKEIWEMKGDEEKIQKARILLNNSHGLI